MTDQSCEIAHVEWGLREDERPNGLGGGVAGPYSVATVRNNPFPEFKPVRRNRYSDGSVGQWQLATTPGAEAGEDRG